MNRIVVATHNPRKGREMREILTERLPQFSVTDLTEFANAPEPEETGTTYEHNAIIKVLSAVETTGELCVADDAGLEVDALPGELGPLSKRFAGEQTSFEKKIQVLLDKLRNVPESRRTARFKCWVVIAGPEAALRSFSASLEGQIALAPVGNGGFGYDPVFFLPELGCTLAELSRQQKHEISHRGQVLRKLCVWIERDLSSKMGRT